VKFSDTESLIHFNPLSVQAGIVTTYIVYNTTLVAGSAAAVTANTGLRLIGLAASMGATYVAGPLAGASVASVSSYISQITQANIKSGTEIVAIASSVVAGTGTLLALTASGYAISGLANLTKQTAEFISEIPQKIKEQHQHCQPCTIQITNEDQSDCILVDVDDVPTKKNSIQ
jgi:hypothetical protein